MPILFRTMPAAGHVRPRVAVAVAGVDCTAVVVLGTAVSRGDRTVAGHAWLVDHIPRPAGCCADTTGR
jgi:hypothetical protein